MRHLLILIILISPLISNAQEEKTDCQNTISGKVFDNQQNTSLSEAFITVKSKTGEIIKLKSDANGLFSFKVPCQENRYVISCVVQNYTEGNALVFTTRNRIMDQEVKLKLYPIKEFIEINGKKRIIVPNINFLPNDKSLTKEAKSSLNQVYNILDKYQNIKIEIGFHTDSRGDEKYLIDLTQQRANICSNYLVNRGIDSNRIISKGYGATVLLNECKKGVKCSNEKHMMNRRSEFIVIEE